MPRPESFGDRAHGERLRYLAGCRCALCKEANNAYARMRGKMVRAGFSDPMIDAGEVLRHVRRLARKGIGQRTIADAARTSRASVHAIVLGRKTKLRRSTAARILAVSADAAGDAALVSAKSTWAKLERLLAEGFTKGELARRLGMKTPALQIRRDRVTVRTRDRVARFYRDAMGKL
jgi:hypothetical protein